MQMRSYFVYLQLLKTFVTQSHEMFKFQHQSRIMRTDREWNLFPGIVGLAPIGSRPMRVKLLQRSITLNQIFLKESLATRAVTVTIKLVVNLPADDFWVGTKVFCSRS